MSAPFRHQAGQNMVLVIKTLPETQFSTLRFCQIFQALRLPETIPDFAPVHETDRQQISAQDQWQ